MSIGAILTAIIAAVGALMYSFFNGKAAGKDEVVRKVEKSNAEETKAAAKVQEDNITISTNVAKKANSNSDSDVDKELADKWTRD